ncbi:hypothetical protein BDR03DRAFT_1019502 [Suillus americanus]|nr:hypothetical protein BDR03DRAFT_1019502 [Suillus americanus]
MAFAVYPLNYHPDRSSPPLPRVPHHSLIWVFPLTHHWSLSLAAWLHLLPSTSSSSPEYRNDYQGGITMASKHIQEILCQPRAKPSSFYSRPPQPRNPVPGQTDGGSEWRQSVYGGYSTRSDNASGGSEKAQTSFAATSRRRVRWTSALSQSNSSSALAAQCPTFSLPPRSGQSYSEELYTKYSLPLSRRSESRMSLFPHSASSSGQSPLLSSTSTSSSCRHHHEVPLLKRGAEGRLLVPDVVLTRNNSSMVLHLDLHHKSYDNIKTYPVMMPPAKKEKHIEHRMVDGEVEEVEVEVEVVQPLKRLFLFPGKDTTFVGRS